MSCCAAQVAPPKVTPPSNVAPPSKVTHHFAGLLSSNPLKNPRTQRGGKTVGKGGRGSKGGKSTKGGSEQRGQNRSNTDIWLGEWLGREGLGVLERGGWGGGHDTPKNEAEEGKERLHDRRKSWHTQNDGSEVGDVTKFVPKTYSLDGGGNYDQEEEWLSEDDVEWWPGWLDRHVWVSRGRRASNSDHFTLSWSSEQATLINNNLTLSW